MTNPYDLYTTDPNIESGEGLKIEYPGFEIVIYRAGGSNEAYSKTFSDKSRAYITHGGTPTTDEAERIILETYAETIVKGWSNLTDKEGKPLPFSVDNCKQLLSDLPELFASIKKHANDFGNFRKIKEEAEIKN